MSVNRNNDTKTCSILDVALGRHKERPLSPTSITQCEEIRIQSVALFDVYLHETYSHNLVFPAYDPSHNETYPRLRHKPSRRIPGCTFCEPVGAKSIPHPSSRYLFQLCWRLLSTEVPPRRHRVPLRYIIDVCNEALRH